MEITIENFITHFKNQLLDENEEVLATTDYVNESYWDSLTSMVIKVMIEDEYSLSIDKTDLNSFSSINDLFDYIKEKSK